jgi:hypothetical protein
MAKDDNRQGMIGKDDGYNGGALNMREPRHQIPILASSLATT